LIALWAGKTRQKTALFISLKEYYCFAKWLAGNQPAFQKPENNILNPFVIFVRKLS
jgi:hypothetical protein